ncbi:PhoH family protein [Limnobacter humi]|uniref:PhoH-like protein n=1 Tax=Limnobacter humi TaxID=1778671 RepID=A0ABT1WBU9_9BURK|nr:PhoH family protein [Limnobacter humi]MCQ8894986.1 PhoH family protein [Limnobacter humi]
MRSKPQEWQAPDDDNSKLANLCGPVDANLRLIEQAFQVKIARRGGMLNVQGDKDAARQAIVLINHFFDKSEKPVTADDIQLAIVELKNTSTLSSPSEPTVILGQDEVVTLRVKRGDLQARTARQKEYLKNVLEHDLTFGIGPAGTGKTYLAVACAVDALERDAVKRIVLTRPAVEAGERLGFLPGDLTQKVDPYLRPLYDALYDLAGYDRVQKWFERNVIEIAPLAYMRGRTLSHAFVILDEAQNTTPEQMKMFLTRIGFGSKAVITGDVTQIDLPRGQQSGLVQAQHVLRQVKGVAMTYFNAQDVVRHPLVARIVEAYERFHNPERRNSPMEDASAQEPQP